jgi:glycine cleavage system H protein
LERDIDYRKGEIGVAVRELVVHRPRFVMQMIETPRRFTTELRLAPAPLLAAGLQFNAHPAPPRFSCPPVEHPLSCPRQPMTLPPTRFYKRATFVTHLPVAHLYSPSHCWLSEVEPARWRVGYTKFALRMLGELVDVQFDRAAGAGVKPGDILGSIEGFKALSDIYSVGEGRFLNGNPALREDLERIGKDPYAEGWLYEFSGKPDSRSMTLDGYCGLLDATIDRILEKQKTSEMAS